MADRGPRAFVCGHPVAHARSPLIHGYWLRQAGLPGSYERVDRRPEDFPDFMRGFAAAGYVGGNVTIPHKEAAYRLASKPDQAAEMIGAANTVWLEDGLVRASNTDWLGFAANLDEHAPRWRSGRTAVVLGAGGAARGVVYALQQAGFRDVRVVNRTTARAIELADRFGGGVSGHGWPAPPELLADADLLVNATALGMNAGDQDAAARRPDLGALPSSALVTDIVYTPLMTPLLAAARERGLAVVDGLGMLLYQAAPGFECWFGQRPAVTAELRALVLADLGKPA